MKFGLRLKSSDEQIDVINAVDEAHAREYFIRRKNIDVEAFTAMFEVVEKKIEKK